MAAERYVVGIDCSTTATKAVVWDETGNSVAEGRAAFPLEAPRPGWYEQDAEEWWRSIKTALKEAAARVDTDRDEQRSAFYDRIYNDVFKELYPRLSDLFPALAEAVEDQGERPT